MSLAQPSHKTLAKLKSTFVVAAAYLKPHRPLNLAHSIEPAYRHHNAAVLIITDKNIILRAV